jgi:hypothetical protein
VGAVTELDHWGRDPESLVCRAGCPACARADKTVGGRTADEWIKWSASGYGEMCSPERFIALVIAAFQPKDAHSRGVREGLERAAEELATRASIARWAAAASAKGSARESELLAVCKELQAAERVIRGQIGADESAICAEASKLDGEPQRPCAADPDGRPCPDLEHCDPCAQRDIFIAGKPAPSEERG